MRDGSEGEGRRESGSDRERKREEGERNGSEGE